MTGVLLVGRCCACGQPLRLHRDDRNRTISCAQLRERTSESRTVDASRVAMGQEAIGARDAVARNVGYPDVTERR
jgi:hypothetical protein